MASHPDLAAEQAHIDRAYDSLERSRVEATRLRSMVEVGKGGTEQARCEREMIEGNIAHRLASAAAGRRQPRVRPDRPRPRARAATPSTSAAWPWPTSNQEPVVVDWRAPVAEPFYRATGRQPMGLVRRRHFATRGRQLLGHRGRAVRRVGRAPRRRAVDRRRRPRDPGPGHAHRRPRGGPHRPPRRHRRHHPGRAGRDHPRRAARRARRAGRPRHRQDRRGPPPRRLPALHPPVPARGPGRAGGRAQPAVPRLHRAGAAVSLGEAGVELAVLADLLDGAGTSRIEGRDRADAGPGQGRPAHGQGAGQGRARPPAAAARDRCGSASASRRSRLTARPEQGHRRRRPPPVPHPQRRPPLRRGQRVRHPGRQRPRRRSRPHEVRRAAAPRTPRSARRSSGCGRCSRPAELLHDLFGSPGAARPRRRRRSCPTTSGARCTGRAPSRVDEVVVDRTTTCRCSTRPARCSARSPGASGPASRPTTRSAPTATSWSTRPRTSRRCSCACSPAARSTAR